MADFKFQHLFPLEKDSTEYRLLTKEYVQVEKFKGEDVLVIDQEGLAYLAEHAMHEVSFYLRPAHQKKVAQILKDPEASDNDKFVARTMLKNSVVAAKGQLPTCQDTGTAIVMGKKGNRVFTEGIDEEFLSKGIWNTYQKDNLRYSQNAPLGMYKEKNTASNLPAQIDIYANEGNEFKFLFLAKGGGSANKTYLYQQTKALLNPETLEDFLVEKMKSLGTAACPPYHLAFVVGGTSAETCLKTVKLASTGYLDDLPSEGNSDGQAFRDKELEEKIMQRAYKCGLGAQFGGKYFVHDVRIIRMPRHGASCPVGMGVSCSADRNIKAKINKEGIWLEQMEHNPAQYLVEEGEEKGEAVNIDLNQPMKEILATLTKYPVQTRLALNGKMIVARDIAHAKLKEMVDAGKELPEYFKNHPVYYAGPAKTPKGMPSGSFGPTTAGRMDPYVDLFQSLGGSLVMIAKGNRSQVVTDACKKHGGFYLGSIGGPAALLAKDNIKKVQVLDFEELGMEAVWEIEVENFPAFILVDDKGNDFFQTL